MSVSKLPNGRYRAQVTHPLTGQKLSAAVVLNLPRKESTFKTERQAMAAMLRAEAKLEEGARGGSTLAEFWNRWLTDPVFRIDRKGKPFRRESTFRTYKEGTEAFVERYGDIPMLEISDAHIAEWLKGGKRMWTIHSLNVMFNDAKRPEAGRIIGRNPFDGVRRPSKKGRGDEQPPTIEEAKQMISTAWRVATPDFAAYLQFGMATGMRPGEIDALRPSDIDGDIIHVTRQFHSKLKQFTPPKTGPRDALLTEQAKEALDRAPGGNGYCFVNTQGNHWRQTTRSWWWGRIQGAVGWHGDLYLATRHYACWYLYEVLGIPADDVAQFMGHTDGGKLVISTYGHRTTRGAFDRIKEADRAHREQTARAHLKAV